MIPMPEKKRKREKIAVVKSFNLDGSFPEIELANIKKSRKKKRRNVKDELENTRMDMLQ
jgi:hypothetical protein